MPALAPHQQRVVDELNELGDKHKKLREFIDTNPIYPELTLGEQNLLRRQVEVMSVYIDILAERIMGFSSSE